MSGPKTGFTGLSGHNIRFIVNITNLDGFRPENFGFFVAITIIRKIFQRKNGKGEILFSSKIFVDKPEYLMDNFFENVCKSNLVSDVKTIN
jgi:hypothetical protein